MTKTERKDKLTNIEDLAETLISIRRRLHEHPEISEEEVETSRFIAECLEDASITVLPTNLKTGVIAEIRGHLPGPTIALRADIDALPIQEETGLPFASKIPGKMHACGHDFHTAAMIGAALLLKTKEKQLRGKIRFIFQPAEEIGTGARNVIDAGYLQDVSAVLGMHNKPDLPVGTIGIKKGPLMAGVGRFEIKIEGKGTHAALPHTGTDPIVVASHIVLALQSIVSRNVNSNHNAVVTVANIQSGNTWNVIPGTAYLAGTVRTFQEEDRKNSPGLIERIINGVAEAYGAKATLHWDEGPPPVQNEELLTELADSVAREMNLQVVEPIPSMAGEDFAYYQQIAKGFFLFMGTSGTEEWHHPSFTVDERALPISAHYFARFAMAVIEELGLKHKKDTNIKSPLVN
jgi:amidohydrolase